VSVKSQPAFHLPARPVEIPAGLLELDPNFLVTLTSQAPLKRGSNTYCAKQAIELFDFIMKEQSRGRFALDVAAQALADEHVLNGHSLLKDMEQSARKGDLTLHDSRTEKPIDPAQLGVYVGMLAYCTPADINTMLTEWGASYRFPVISVAIGSNTAFAGDGAAPSTRREKGTTIRDDAVIEALRKRGVDPLNMPTAPLGDKPWPLREEIQSEMRISKTMAKQSFTRQRKAGRMRSQPDPAQVDPARKLFGVRGCTARGWV
jgi:hypothetical protein